MAYVEGKSDGRPQQPSDTRSPGSAGPGAPVTPIGMPTSVRRRRGDKRRFVPPPAAFAIQIIVGRPPKLTIPFGAAVFNESISNQRINYETKIAAAETAVKRLNGADYTSAVNHRIFFFSEAGGHIDTFVTFRPGTRSTSISPGIFIHPFRFVPRPLPAGVPVPVAPPRASRTGRVESFRTSNKQQSRQ